MSEMNQQMAKQVLESLKEVLDEMKVPYEEKVIDSEKSAIIFDYRGEDTGHRMVIRVDAGIGLVGFSERLDFSADPSAVAKIVDACNRINSILYFGSFYYDYGDAAVYFYNPLLFNNSIISGDTINEMMMRTVNVVETYDDRLSAINKGYLEPEKVIPEQ